MKAEISTSSLLIPSLCNLISGYFLHNIFINLCKRTFFISLQLLDPREKLSRIFLLLLAFTNEKECFGQGFGHPFQKFLYSKTVFILLEDVWANVEVDEFDKIIMYWNPHKAFLCYEVNLRFEHSQQHFHWFFYIPTLKERPLREHS